MQQHIEKLRSLLSKGLDRGEALKQLRDAGVSPIVCVKALCELETIDRSEAKDLVERLKATPQSSREARESSPQESVAQALTALAEPPVDLETTTDQGSWFSVVTAREASVLWRFVCERSVWRLEAAPAWAPDESFDGDVLSWHFLGRGLSQGPMNIEALMAITAADLVADIEVLRRSVVQGFREDTWAETRAHLERLELQRGVEMFGRPTPPGNAG